MGGETGRSRDDGRQSEELTGPDWEELCELYDLAAKEVAAAMRAVMEKVAAGHTPTVEELVRLENARASRNDIERQMQDLSTTRR
jgi:hypothetical protein